MERKGRRKDLTKGLTRREKDAARSRITAGEHCQASIDAPIDMWLPDPPFQQRNPELAVEFLRKVLPTLITAFGSSVSVRKTAALTLFFSSLAVSNLFLSPTHFLRPDITFTIEDERAQGAAADDCEDCQAPSQRSAHRVCNVSGRC